MEKEKLSKHLARRFDKENNRWSFNGTAFTSQWREYHGQLGYLIIITRTGNSTTATVWLDHIAGERIEKLEDVNRFTGKDSFAKMFEWVAELFIKRDNELAEIADEVIKNRRAAFGKLRQKTMLN